MYEIYPKAHVPPYHYRNPVTGEAPHYPGGRRPECRARRRGTRRLCRSASTRRARRTSTRRSLQAERTVERVKDYHELDNLQSAYGYYLDKNLWNNLADLFAKDGSIELAQRGVYKGQKRVREFLFAVFGRGREGPGGRPARQSRPDAARHPRRPRMARARRFACA